VGSTGTFDRSRPSEGVSGFLGTAGRANKPERSSRPGTCQCTYSVQFPNGSTTLRAEQQGARHDAMQNVGV
jgi:hypothetical protein